MIVRVDNEGNIEGFYIERTRMTGTVKRIVKDKGFGFILGEDRKEYFFHRTALKNKKFEELAEGDEVEFEDSDGSKGPRAEDVYA